MDLGIKELVITLMVGAFTILGFEAILHYFFNKGVTGFFEGRLGLHTHKRTSAGISNSESTSKVGMTSMEKDQTMTVATFIVLAFAIGVIAEDLS